MQCSQFQVQDQNNPPLQLHHCTQSDEGKRQEGLVKLGLFNERARTNRQTQVVLRYHHPSDFLREMYITNLSQKIGFLPRNEACCCCEERKMAVPSSLSRL